MDKFSSIAIVGLGLIGGSLAALIRAHFPDRILIGVDSDSRTCALATQSGIFTEVHPSIAALPRTLNLVFVCTPIPLISPEIESLSRHIHTACIFTDVGSIKSKLPVPQLANPAHQFIPGHPMGGTEHSGFAHSCADILRGAPYILTPDVPEVAAPLAQFLTGLGFKVALMSGEVHDRMVAAASHLPYVMACITVAAGYPSTEFDAAFRAIVGPGFRDTTRVAASAPQWGAAVCLGNRQHLEEVLEAASQTLSKLTHLVHTEDQAGLIEFFTQAQTQRKQLYP